MSADYFLHRLTLAEARDYIQGQDRRHREQWLMTKVLSEVVCGSSGATTESGEAWTLDLPWMESEREEVKQGDFTDTVELYKRLLEKQKAKGGESVETHGQPEADAPGTVAARPDGEASGTVAAPGTVAENE